MRTYVFFWEIKPRSIVSAFLLMAVGHLYLKPNKTVTFYKLLGTGKGETFTPKDANLTRWGLIISTSQEKEVLKFVKLWRKIAIHEKFFELAPLSSHGLWSKRNPFLVGEKISYEGKTVAITRAKIKRRLALAFWRSVPPVVQSLKSSPGLIWSIGIGESPIGLQGTFSLWESAKALEDFAFRGSEHRVAIRKTRDFGWYSEELFARFKVVTEAE